MDGSNFILPLAWSDSIWKGDRGCWWWWVMNHYVQLSSIYRFDLLLTRNSLQIYCFSVLFSRTTLHLIPSFLLRFSRIVISNADWDKHSISKWIRERILHTMKVILSNASLQIRCRESVVSVSPSRFRSNASRGNIAHRTWLFPALAMLSIAWRWLLSLK
jgi:hypothetical protein